MERKLAALEARVGLIDEDVKNLPELIKTEHRLTNSQVARLSRDLDDLRGKFDDLSGRLDVMPRAWPRS